MKKISNKTTIKYLYTFGFIILIGLGIFTLWTSFGPENNKNFYTVESGSMKPNISIGSLIFISKKDTYFGGDVVTAKVPDIPRTTYTHRIVGIETKNANVMYRTKGDANDAVDSALIAKSDVLGKVTLEIPLVGFIAMFSKSKVGLFTLIILPALIIVFIEARKIKEEISKMISEKKIPSEKPKLSKKVALSILLFSLPLLSLSAITLVSKTESLYLNSVQSVGNTFTAETIEVVENIEETENDEEPLIEEESPETTETEDESIDEEPNNNEEEEDMEEPIE